jgi:hypothetical protein
MCPYAAAAAAAAVLLPQVTIEYLRDGGHLEPLRVHTLLISTQHNPDISMEELQQELMEHVVKPVIPPNLLTEHTQYFLNPSKRCAAWREGYEEGGVCHKQSGGGTVGRRMDLKRRGEGGQKDTCHVLLQRRLMWCLLLPTAGFEGKTTPCVFRPNQTPVCCAVLWCAVSLPCCPHSFILGGPVGGAGLDNALVLLPACLSVDAYVG